MLRIASGITDQYLHFNAGQLGLSDFTVTRVRNNGTPATMTTPTIAEVSSSLIPGEYALLLDEDMTIGSGNLTEQMVFWITHAGITPVRKEVELFAETNTEITAIKVQTDKMVFTVANELDVNVLSFVGTTYQGDGTLADKLRSTLVA